MTEASPPTFETVAIEQQGAIAWVRLDRPQQANALDLRMWAELPQAMDWLATQRSVRAIVLCGNGKHFTGGIDISVIQWLSQFVKDPKRQTRGHEEVLKFIESAQDAFTAVERNPVPVIAAIHGACIGGGVDLIAACDMRICAADAKFSIKEVDLAVVPDVGTLQRLRHVIGYSAMTELTYTAESFGADRARELGLVSRVCADHDELMKAAQSLAETVAAKPPTTTRGIKRNLLWSREHNVKDGLEYASIWNTAMLLGEDLQEAISAYIEKRAPKYED